MAAHPPKHSARSSRPTRQQHSILPPRDPRRRRRLWPFRQPGGPAFRGTISAAQGELNGKRERSHGERGKSERRAHSSLEGGLAFCYFWLRWNTAGRLSVGCHKKSDLFSSLSPMKLLCFLLPGAEEGRRGGRRCGRRGGRTVVAVGQRSVAGSLSLLRRPDGERAQCARNNVRL